MGAAVILHSGVSKNPRKSRRHSLLRLFSLTFPDGRAGIGILLLRVATGLTAAVQGGVYLFEGGNRTSLTWALGLLLVASGVSLLIGILTPVAGILVGLGSIAVGLSWFPAAAQNLLDKPLTIGFIAIMAAAIVFLGSGAYSLDARLFGRREIIIPQASRSPES
jgi:hypothetical protein